MDHKYICDKAYFIWQNTGRDDAGANWKQAEEECKKTTTPATVVSTCPTGCSTDCGRDTLASRDLQTARHLSNPGIGDSSFIYRDKALKEGLRKFDPSSYELSIVVPKEIQTCGGYEYHLKILKDHDEINAFIDKWETRRLARDDAQESSSDSESNGGF